MWTAAFFVEHYFKIFLLERFFAVHEIIKIGATNILVAVTKVVQHHYFNFCCLAGEIVASLYVGLAGKLGGCCPEKKIISKESQSIPQHSSAPT